jgi:DNA polymerase III subunit gamma/tau
MENFVVSARKYRPITFDSVVGQSHITTTLKNAIRTNHLAQAFLFCGPRGVGKTTCARILAKTINCQRLDDSCEPCGQCESCLAFQQNASFNVHELDAASNNSVEDIRNLIDQVRYPPQAGSKKKIYIIDEVHMLSTSAFNAFLKTLEEPPSYAIFILATTEKHKILPTILSRCQIFDFNRIQIKDIADHLSHIAQNESITAEYEALELIAQKADGGLRDALSMFDLNVTFSKDNLLRYTEVLENLHILDYDYYFKMTDALINQQLPNVFLLFDEILRKGFDGHQFVVGLLEHFRNLLVCKDTQTIKLLQVSERVQQQYHQQATKASISFLLSGLSVGNQCDIQYKQAKNQRLHVEICLSKLAHISSVVDVTSISDEKKKTKHPTALASAPISQEIAPVYEKAIPSPTSQAISQLGNRIANSSRLRSTVDIIENVQKSSEKKQQDTVTATIQMAKPYTFEQLKEAWQEFTILKEQNGKTSEVIILKRDFILQGQVIQLLLDNAVQIELLNDFRADLMTFLRDKLQNTAIQLSASIAQQSQSSRPYTQQEKFNYLAEKNPSLVELKGLLGLDFDY